jgi:Uncharacterized small protein (DUF2158).
MADSTFKVGDVVEIKSGGGRMTVTGFGTKYGTEERVVHVMGWGSSGGLSFGSSYQHYSLPEACLRVVEDKSVADLIQSVAAAAYEPPAGDGLPAGYEPPVEAEL